jgi:hypothetical protein
MNKQNLVVFRVTDVENRALQQMAKLEHQNVSGMLRKFVHENAWKYNVVEINQPAQKQEKQTR